MQEKLVSSSSSCRFWFRDKIHFSGPPSRQLASCTHGRSHTISPGVSIMRVDSRELPLSAIPLCQLLPGHLGPPKPPLSYNLFVIGCAMLMDSDLAWCHLIRFLVTLTLLSSHITKTNISLVCTFEPMALF